ncbi:MAG: hypothetical protein QXK12_01945 [Candidatus Nezhaarchaeales archaeon]
MKIRLTHPERCIGCLNCVLACSRELYRSSSIARAALIVKSSSIANHFTVVICPACKDPPCVTACPYNALKAQPEGGPTLVNPEKCKECKTYDCTIGCVTGVLVIDRVTGTPIICTQCGECAKYCPHEVITYGEAP